MNRFTPWYNKQIKNRKLVETSKKGITGIQFIGFSQILIGVLFLLYKIIFPMNGMNKLITGEEMALTFFIIMLGLSFVFPSLLKNQNKGLSTMRIAVFMIINVICLLLLKIGWNPDIKTFKDIGIDWYWTGIIAFVFGAKATQAFFESKGTPIPEQSKTGVNGIEFTNADIAKLAVEQNQQYLKVKFPNIVSISDTVHDLNQTETHVIAIYLKDNNTIGIPDKLEVKMPNGVKTIGTEIVKNVGAGKIHVSQKSIVDTGSCKGSVCCLVDTNQGFNAVVTAGHVYSNDTSVNHGGELNNTEQTEVNIDNQTGKWIFQLINYKNDVALISVEKGIDYSDYVTFKGKKHYQVSDHDIKNTQVNLISNVSGKRIGYILDYFTTWDVGYDDKVLSKNNIILIGSTNNRDTSKSVTLPGDSGGCVYEPKSGNLVGIILGGNNSFTWVLPLQEVFEQFSYNLL
jgi:hypothetical protein